MSSKNWLTGRTQRLEIVQSPLPSLSTETPQKAEASSFDPLGRAVLSPLPGSSEAASTLALFLVECVERFGE